MNQEMRCTMFERDAIAEAYAASRLDSEAHERFEHHLLSCKQCQDEVLLAMSVRTALGQEAHAVNRRRLALFTAAGLMAAALALVVVWPATDGPEGARDVTPLGNVAVPPSYLGVAVRGGVSADSAFELGMRRYDEANWIDAAQELRRAATLGASTDVTWFFVGASELMADRAEQADSAFARVVLLGDGPYVDEARFYRAKALLRLGRGRDALALLNGIPRQTTVGTQASSLADSLRASGIR